MTESDKPDPAAAARAARLRAQIESLKKGDSESPDEAGEEELSPRDFIHKRMRELDRKPKG